MGASGTNVPHQMIVSAGFDKKLQDFEKALDGASDLRQAQEIAAHHGQQLWLEATTRTRSNVANTDDRPIYWTRLGMTAALRAWKPKTFRLSDAERVDLIDRLELESRGMKTASFTAAAKVKKILISGFDPFDLDDDITRSNPSGAAVLALDGQSISKKGFRGEIQGVILPVRFKDFDKGLIERFFGPYISGPGRVDMIMTLSDNYATRYDVEQYAGRGRTTGTPDNLNERGYKAGDKFLNADTVEPATLDPDPKRPGKEYYQTTLPAKTIRRALGKPAKPDAEEAGCVASISGKSVEGPCPQILPRQGGSDAKILSGSGGNFLSNEVFYRVMALRGREKSRVPAGHFHIETLVDTTTLKMPVGPIDATRDRIIATVRRVLTEVLSKL
jgi:pyrrolidone-carboxylate peptidase